LFARALEDNPAQHLAITYLIPSRQTDSGWTMAATFHRTTEDAAREAIKRAKGHDTYFGVGLMGGPPGRGRGTANDVGAVTCLWADLDIEHSAHEKANLPKTEAEVRAILKRVGLKPSLVVRSGHGLQAYWLLSEPWVLDSVDERQAAARLAKRWSDTVRACAIAEGFDADGVGDLARVMRVPGTFNRKQSHDIKAVVLVDPITFEPLGMSRLSRSSATTPTNSTSTLSPTSSTRTPMQ
jgi:hypothetical protein